MELEKTIVEINGIKMEIDLRQAKVIDNYKVGDKIKLLKKSWSDKWDSCLGVIVGFDGFEKRPTIIIAYLENNKIAYCYYNSAATDVEITRAHEEDLPFTKEHVLDALNRDIQQKEAALSDAKFMRDNFLKWFGKYFEQAQETKVA